MKDKKQNENNISKASSTEVIPNKFEHHTDIKRTPLTPFKAKRITCCHNSGCNWHDNLEILFITDGTGTLRYGTQRICLSPNTVMIINSQTMHSISSEKGVSFYMYIIDNRFFEENGIDVSKYTFEKVSHSDILMNICREAYNEFQKDKDFLSISRQRSIFLSLIIELCENHIQCESSQETQSTASEQYVKKAMEYITDNYTENLNLEMISKIIGINKSYFAREFKKHTGQTVHTYINSIRCKNADMCLSRGMSVTNTASACGFESLSYFSRIYKKHRSFSPKEYSSTNDTP